MTADPATVSMGLENILDGGGLPIAVYGMGLVFVALVLLSCFIALLPRGVALFERLRPLRATPHTGATVSLAPGADGDERALVAALVAAVVHQDPAVSAQAGYREG